ncbi:MAG: YggT family protein [Armatimonadota bacterium]|nr:MAG: YggT family protein [Armatimonadota bacterium]
MSPWFGAASLVGIIHLIFWVLQLLVFARVIMSWIRVAPHHPLVHFVHDTTEPMLRPFRAVLRVGPGGIDFSPLILLLVLWVAERLVISIIVGAP